MTIEQGFDGIAIAIFNEDGGIITNKVTKFNYTHSDELEDTSTIVIKLENPKLIDHPNLQVDQRIFVSWGYTNDVGGSQKRILWIYDVKHDFTNTGIKITLECMCKAGYLRFNARTGAGELSMDELLKSMSKDAGINYKGFDFNTKPDTEIDININTRGPSTIGALSTEVVSSVDWDDSDIPSYSEQYEAFKTLGATDEQADVAAKKAIRNAKDKQTKVQHQYTLDASKAVVARDATAYVQRRIIVLPGKSDASVIEQEKKRNLVNELQVTGRDDDILVTKRNWFQKAYKSYTYKQDPGNVLEFHMSTHNKEAKKQGTQIDFAVVNAASKSIDRGSVDNSNNTSPALGRLIEMTREGLAKQPRFKDMSVMVAGLRKKTVTPIYNDAGEVLPAKVEYSEVQFISKNDTYVAVVHIRGSKLSLDEHDKSMFFDDPVPEKYSRPPIAGALGYTSIDGSGFGSGRNFTERGKENNATHMQEDWDGKGVAVVERYIPVATKEYIQIIEEDLRKGAQTVYNQISEDALKLREASLDVIGDPSLVSGKIISIANVGNIWSGNYYIHKAVHTIDSKGYTVKCELYKNAMGKAAGMSENLIEARDLGIPTNNDIAAVESDQQGGQSIIVTEEIRPDLPLP